MIADCYLNPLGFSSTVYERINAFRRAKWDTMDGRPIRAIATLRRYGYTVEQAKSYLGIGAIMQGSNM